MTPTTPPSRIGPYPIERELGRGAMGIVYLGRDTSLGRPVAVKVLPPAVAEDPERLARFDREARLLAAVHHPNVATIFAVGGDANERFLALEYVAGESLQQRLVRGPLGVREAVDVCRQIAAGLEAAHEAGVIHRDLKPGNVRITPAGVAKVLDFGLAKAGNSASGSGSNPEDATKTCGATEEGIVLGTLPYMSPEQARGTAVDRRTDIWALGCVLFECLTGRPPFGGPSTTDLVAGIVLRDPAWELLPAATPPRLQELLRRCLEKDRQRRLRDAGDLRLELEAIAGEGSSSGWRPVGEGAPPPVRTRRGLIATAVLGALAIGAIGWWLGRSDRTPAAPARRLSVIVPAEVELDAVEPSPQGDSLLVLGRPRGAPLSEERIYRRSLDSFELVPIAGTEGARLDLYTAPDGSLRFLSARKGTESELWMTSVAAAGGTPTPLYPLDPTWADARTLPDGSDLVGLRGGAGFVVIPAGSREASAVRQVDVGFPADFQFYGLSLGDGKWVLMSFGRATAEGYFQGTAAVEVATGKGHVVLADGRAAALVDDVLLFSRAGTIYGVRFDPVERRTRGPEVALIGGLRVFKAGFGGWFQVTEDGTLWFHHGGNAAADRQLVACVPEGRCTPWSPRRHFVEATVLSTGGGEVVAGVVGPRGTLELWAFAANGAGRPLVARPGRDAVQPAWSRDGSTVAYFDSTADREIGTYLIGTGEPSPRLLFGVDAGRLTPVAWLPGNRELVLRRRPMGGGNSDVAIADVTRPGEPARDVLATPLDERPIDASPVHRQIAYVSDTTGQPEIFLAELLPGDRLGPPVPLSRGPGALGRFSPDGRAFYFYDGSYEDIYTTNGNIRRVRLGADGLPTSDPEIVLDPAAERLFTSMTVLPDGRLVLLRKGRLEERADRLDVVLGFADEVRARMATKR